MRNWAILAACAVTSIAAVVAVLHAAPDTAARLAVGTWAQAFAEVAGALACAMAARHTRGRARLTWTLFAAAEVIWVVTDSAFAVTEMTGIEVGEVSLVDLGWLSFYIPAGLATVLLYMRLRPERGAQGPIDGLIATVGLAAFAWGTVIGDIAKNGSGGVSGTLVVTLYPLLDFLCAVTLGWIVLRHGRRAPAWLWLVVAAFSAQMLAGTAYLISALPGGSLDLVNVGAFMAAGWFWAAAGMARMRMPQRTWAAGAHDRPPAWSETAPFLIATMVIVLGAIRPDPELRVAAVVAAILVGIRATAALRVGRGLIAERDRLLVTDPLTGAYNRRFLVEEGDRAWARARRAGEPLSVIAVDLDRFKQVNDKLGHLVGDRLLTAVCTEISRSLRAGDILFRLGGDEFLVLCPSTDTEGTLIVAERVRACVAEAAAAVVPEAGVAASLGVATYPVHAADLEDLLRTADTALYDAKARGRNRVAVAVAAAQPVS